MNIPPHDFIAKAGRQHTFIVIAALVIKVF
jgi:hypothetical protein